MQTISKKIEYCGESGRLEITGFPTIEDIRKLDTDELQYLLKGAENYAKQHDASRRFRAPFEAWENKPKDERGEKPEPKYVWRFAELVELSKGRVSKALTEKAEAMLAYIGKHGDDRFTAKAELYGFDCPETWDLESCLAYQRAKQEYQDDIA